MDFRNRPLIGFRCARTNEIAIRVMLVTGRESMSGFELFEPKDSANALEVGLRIFSI